MTTQTAQESVPQAAKPDGFAKARAAKAAKAKARSAAGSIGTPAPALDMAALAALMKQTVDEAITPLKAEIETIRAAPKLTPVLPRTFGPENDLKMRLNKMRAGERREGVRTTDLLNPRAAEDGFGPNDIVLIREDVAKPDLQLKTKAFRKNLGLQPDEPILGKVLQFLGPTKGRKGPNKYKVHVQGIGRDGFTQDELQLIEAAS